MLRVIFSALLAGTVLAGTSVAQEATRPDPASLQPTLEASAVTAAPIPRFQLGAEETHFGRLEYVGGLELSGDHPEFGSISGFRFRDGHSRFLAVSDRGYWLLGQIVRDDDGRPRALDSVYVQTMADPDGPNGHKRRFDAESLAIRDDIAFVGFEQEHRVVAYDIARMPIGPETDRYELPIPVEQLRNNASFEALALSPEDSHLEGALLAITERSTDEEGNILAAILEGPEKGIFKIIRRDGFDITDSVFLPSGDLLLLERSVGLATGIRIRIRQIALQEIHPYALLGGEVILEADLRHEIDNMEAIDAWLDKEGGTRIAILSDDNHLRLQRTVYLEFRMPEQQDAGEDSDADGDQETDSTGRNSENSMP